MRRSFRYVLALLAAGGIVAALARLTDSSVLLLAGIGQVYAVGIAIVLRPAVRRLASPPSSTAGTAFSGVTTFSVLAIAQGVTDGFHVGAAALAFGLAYFGYVSGVWMLVETAGIDADDDDDDEQVPPPFEDGAESALAGSPLLQPLL